MKQIDGSISPKVGHVLDLIGSEFLEARTKFSPFNSAHEGYAILLEEVDELWEAIKSNDPHHARKEALQVAAMALAFLLEVG
jgi:NTP pyrophosphatase (non-canonical NTP hydrolase)